MRIDIISVVPELLTSPFDASILKRAIDAQLVEIRVHNLRDFSSDQYNSIDDYQFGGGAGMVMMVEPIDKCITQLKSERSYDEIIYMSPDGDSFTQSVANQLSMCKNIIILCGHYKGVDQRVRDHLITRELSIGDYVLSGGELAAAVIADSIIRVLPGAISDETSALTDSFQDNLLAPPVYSRPADFNGMKVPEILLSGDNGKIEEWRYEQSLERTKLRRPDLLGDE